MTSKRIDRAYAVIKDVVWQVGRTGVLTPVAIFKDPVFIGTVYEKDGKETLSGVWISRSVVPMSMIGDANGL